MKEAYILVVVVSTKLTEREKLVDEIGSRIESLGAKIVKKTNMGLKELAYKIQNQSKGDFWQLEVESEKPLQLKDFNLFLNREVNVIRYLVLKK